MDRSADGVIGAVLLSAMVLAAGAACGTDDRGRADATPDADARPMGDAGPTEVTTEELSDGSFVCRPAGAGPFPAVLYNHGGRGMAVGGDLRGVCESLAGEGYLARSERRPATVEIVGHLDDVLVGLVSLRAHEDADTSRVAIMGFSRGGLLALQTAIAQPSDVQAVILQAPAPAMNMLTQSLMDAGNVTAPVLVQVAENDTIMAEHVVIAQEVHDALVDAEKEVELTIYPAFGTDGHSLFFEVRDPWWSDVLAFLSAEL
jgi:dienelactone hydrolase